MVNPHSPSSLHTVVMLMGYGWVNPHTLSSLYTVVMLMGYGYG